MITVATSLVMIMAFIIEAVIAVLIFIAHGIILIGGLLLAAVLSLFKRKGDRFGVSDGWSEECLPSNYGIKYKKRREPFLTNEEILAAGLYPNDEGYEMSLISSILNK